MRIRSWSMLALALLVMTQLSCATMGLTPLPDTMPAARAGLWPEYRLFYDALQDYGDWTLIEPFGYVFRPYGNVVGWRPYQYGYWAPSDLYGWVWISTEPYGWATYHYGDWFYDRYQGWVWLPGLDWGPAWVTWEESSDFIGWAPMFPDGYSPEWVPGGAYVYVPAAALPSPDVQTRVRTKEQLGEILGAVRPIENPREQGGVTFNAGPPFELIERHYGPLSRVKVAELFPAASPITRPGAKPGRPAAPAPSKQPAVQDPATHSAPGETADPTAVEAMRRAAKEAAREARSVTEQKSPPPPSIEVVRAEAKREPPASGTPDEASSRERPRRPAHERSEADSTKK
jgi:hypothetical protein